MRSTQVLQTSILIIVYILLGNARSLQPNPYLDGAFIAVNMIVPVIAGILFGPRVGLLVGLLGTAINGLFINTIPYELGAILPHACMGWLAGMLIKRYPLPVAALSIAVGHVLNLLSFVLIGVIPFATLSLAGLWFAILYESIISIIVIMIIVVLYRVAVMEHSKNATSDD